MPKKTIRFTLIAKDTEHVFHKDLGPGVLAYQEAEYDLPEDYSKTRFAKSVIDTANDFRDGLIAVKIEDVGTDEA